MRARDTDWHRPANRGPDASLLPHATLAYWHWPVLALLPLAEAYGAMFCPVDHPARPAAHGLRQRRRAGRNVTYVSFSTDDRADSVLGRRTIRFSEGIAG